jgi:hypothetical protein
VTAAADFILIERASYSIGLQTEQSLNDLRNDFSVLANSIANGVTNVVPPRRIQEQVFISTVSAILTNAQKEILIMGISLRKFLDSGQPLYRLIHDFCSHDKDIKIRLLFVDPFSLSTGLRSAVEQNLTVLYEEGQLFSDLDSSVFGINSEKRSCVTKNQFSLDARFYSCQIPFFMIQTHETLLMEPYHLGRAPDDPPCIGGFVPMVQFEAGSSMYDRVTQHFEFVWDFVKTNEEFRVRAIDSEFWSRDDIPWTRLLEEVLADVRSSRAIRDGGVTRTNGLLGEVRS